jgi:hypothetical protein
MTTEPNTMEPKHHKTRIVTRSGGGEAVYGLGMIGAWIYFIGHAATFWIGVLGFIKGILWPAFMVFELLKYLHM